MTKLKKAQYKIYAGITLAVLVGLVGLLGSAKAYQSYSNAPKVVIENGDYIEAQADKADAVLGSMASPDVESLYLGVNGDMTYHIVAPFIDASTTFVTFANPFGTTVTATVELAKIDVTTAATATAYIDCGASSDGLGAPDVLLIDSGEFVTSTVGLIENNLTAALGGIVDGGTVAKIALTRAYPYFVCYASSTVSAGFTNANETFDGQATVRISHTR